MLDALTKKKVRQLTRAERAIQQQLTECAALHASSGITQEVKELLAVECKKLEDQLDRAKPRDVLLEDLATAQANVTATKARLRCARDSRSAAENSVAQAEKDAADAETENERAEAVLKQG